MRLALALLAVLWLASPVWAACTGSSPNLSAPDTGNAVTNGTNLAACITAAVLGDVITLTAGATYQGNFALTDKGAGTSPIVIQSSALSALPAGARVSPGQLSSMAKVVTNNGSPVFRLNVDSHHWALAGLEITTTAAPYAAGQRVPYLIANDDSGAITYNHWPRNITLDRCWLHPNETYPLYFRAAEEGVVIDGADITISNSYIADFIGWGADATIATVTAATNASPTQITMSTTNGNPGRKVLLSFQGATGNWTPINGTKLATWVDSTHYTLENFDPATFALSNLNTTSLGSFSGQSVSQLSQGISTSRGILIQVGPGPYTITNNFLEAYYTPIFTGGASGTWIDPQNSVTVSAVTDLTHVTLSGVGQLQVNDLIALKTMQDQTVSDAVPHTDTAYTALTVQTHGFPANTILYKEGYVTVSGFTGAWAVLNGKWGPGIGGSGNAYAINSTHIAIQINSTGLTLPATGSGMKWVATVKEASAGNTQWHVGKVTNISGNNITYQWWGHQPDNTNGNGAGLLVASGSVAQFRGRNPANITVTRNTFSIPRSLIWLMRDNAKTCDNCTGQPPKAFWEAKTADDVLIEGNIFQIEGGALDDTGTGIVGLALNQASQIGSVPWGSLNRWTIRNNIFKGVTYHKFSLQEEFETGTVSSDLTITNNLFTLSPSGFISIEGSNTVTITHNTSRNLSTGAGDYHGYLVISNSNTNSTVRDNLGNWGTYGYQDFSTVWAPTRDHNYLIDNLSQSFTPPTGDVYVANAAAMGFTDVTGADAGGDHHGYKLTVGSVGHNAASDGTDIGVNFALLDAALGGVTAAGTITAPGGLTLRGGTSTRP